MRNLEITCNVLFVGSDDLDLETVQETNGNCLNYFIKVDVFFDDHIQTVISLLAEWIFFYLCMFVLQDYLTDCSSVCELQCV